jgi:hypothetical protein
LERLEAATRERQAELRAIERQTSEAKTALQRATLELNRTKDELKKASSELLERFQSEMSISGLDEQDICEGYAEVYLQDHADAYCKDISGEP